MEVNKIYNEDCLETLKRLPDNSIDLMLTDPPYNVTRNEWDKPIDLDVLWLEWHRVVKPNGAIVITSQQPFTTDLIKNKPEQEEFTNRFNYIFVMIFVDLFSFKFA